MAPLTEKTAIVTGGSGGIGSAIARRLAEDGAAVVINYVRNADKAQEVVAAIEARGGQALAIQADISQVADIHHLFQKAIAHFGELNILINNAVKPGAFKPIAEVTEAEFDEQFAVNTRGTFFALQEAARQMADGGRIVNISTVGTINSVPAGASVYTGTKAAVEQFTMALARELGGRGITVNTVSPGVTETEGFRKNAPPEMQILAAQMSPLGRIGQPQDIGDVVGFLVSDQARWLTGQNIRACGGAA